MSRVTKTGGLGLFLEPGGLPRGRRTTSMEESSTVVVGAEERWKWEERECCFENISLPFCSPNSPFIFFFFFFFFIIEFILLETICLWIVV